MKRSLLLIVALSYFFACSCIAKINDLRSLPQPKIDLIHIEKQKRRMTLFFDNNKSKSYRIALGFSPQGPKLMEGDGKTPEGVYSITYKNPQSQFYRSLKLSYPTPQDWQRAKRLGQNPGSNIMIHGLGEFYRAGKWHVLKDWTLGCIAVTNEEMDEIYRLVDVGTKVKISP
ncbi:L,D-transpeptidase family protein [Candidatus Berkiella aquae]|uniref:L,D-transpeptidase catalytic domain n=1 Tax=Candidatus Berkiella aquae TaxID=295108 RepID=A0A0Q9YW61_9GAMM|nr:L,D-transpeptidase family protein [Candidatus Berkiella aquae]MCS5710109.1 L,D-transpeptidase family protein [Candidatus Berkiella aquae]